jgi:signal transduction histidine kinase
LNPLVSSLAELRLECAVFRDGKLSWMSKRAGERLQEFTLGAPVPSRWPLLREAVRATATDGRPRELHDPAARVALLGDEVIVLFTTQSTAELETLSAVSRLAHDLRNPLAGVMSALTVLGGRIGPEEQVVAGHMKRSLERLAWLVDQLVFFARPVVPTLRPAEIDGVVRAAFGDVSREYPRLRLEAEPLEITVPCDPRLLRHCFRNLIANAAQMMPEGGAVWVEGERSLQSVRVGVEDEGPGVDPAALHRIFEPFYSTHGSGHGLGLTVAARIAEAHGGRLAASAGRRGARFTVELPAGG